MATRDINEFFARVEDGFLAKFAESAFVQHAGDKGQNREEDLRAFLGEHLPRRYGVTRGEVITKQGQHGHSADIIVYDADNCPLVYVGETTILPIEGVYGIIEVKSRLSKGELTDAVSKIKAFKDLAPRDLSVIQTRQYFTVHRPSRPFGIVFAYALDENSLESLQSNLEELHHGIHWVNCFANMVAVLGAGILRYEKVDFAAGEKHLLLDTDEFVALVETQQKRQRTNEPPLETGVRLIREETGSRTFGRFFVYLLIMLARLKLGVPDLAGYVDPSLPPTLQRES